MTRKYCSGPISEDKYGSCCENHDADYGNRKPFDRTRAEADLEFRQCMMMQDPSNWGLVVAYGSWLILRLVGWLHWKVKS